MRQLDPKARLQLMIANSINVSSWANLKRSMQFLLYLLMVNMSSWGKFSNLHRLNDAVFWREKSLVFCARQKVNLWAHRKSILRAWFFSSNRCVKLSKFETELAISFIPPDFVISSFRIKMAFYQTHEPFIFLNLKIWIFGSFKTVLGNQPTTMAFLPLQSSKLSNLKTTSISMQILVTISQIFMLRKIKDSYVWRNDKCISTFWEKATFRRYEKRI